LIADRSDGWFNEGGSDLKGLCLFTSINQKEQLRKNQKPINDVNAVYAAD
jgi:hypothetical protein